MLLSIGFIVIHRPAAATSILSMMISKSTLDEFVAPYYRQLIPRVLERSIMPFIA